MRQGRGRQFLCALGLIGSPCWAVSGSGSGQVSAVPTTPVPTEQRPTGSSTSEPQEGEHSEETVLAQDREAPPPQDPVSVPVISGPPEYQEQDQIGEMATHLVLEDLPEQVEASARKRFKEIEKAGGALEDAPAALIGRGLRRWAPGQVVRVAFNGGSDAMRVEIEKIATLWVAPDAANLHLNFRREDGGFRTWSTTDRAYAAEIRIGFEGGAYQSVIGAESVDYRLAGGSPSEASMTLGGFDAAPPEDWQAIVLHEFGHAIGFMHEHQSPEAQCGWRLADDKGYRPMLDAAGWFTVDRLKRRPGIYTYLGGKANYWKRAKVSANLLRLPDGAAFDRTEFDGASIMKYAMPAFLFEKGEESPCFLARPKAILSSLDRYAAAAAYPRDGGMVLQARQVQAGILERVVAGKGIATGLQESASRRLEVLRLTPQ